ncbi:MAG TPA: hypothetical protein VLT33_20235, partial [Labilithrix sp.]|nr:hypothetical protein [Labilithrix sp.]
ESSTVRLNADGTPLAPRVAPPEASLRGAERPRSADVDFTSKHTSDGTEVTVPMSVGSRYLGLFVAVAALALVVGGVGVFLFARSTGAPEASASPSASVAVPAASISLGNLPPTVAEPDPRTAPLDVASAAASASAAPRHGAPVTKAGAPPLSAAARSTPAASSAAAPVATTSAAPAAPQPEYNSASAYVALGALSHAGVRDDALRKKMGEILPKLSECYRSALMIAAAPIGGSAEIHMSIDDKGAITAIVNAPKLPQFARCVQGTLAGQRVAASALESGSGGATASQWLTLHP